MTEIDPAALVAQHVPASFVAEAVRAVDQAKVTYATNHDRREWAVIYLRTHLHTPEWLSRLLIELAIAWIKTRQQEGERS